MNGNNECWQYQTGGWQYPEKPVTVKLGYIPKRNSTDIDACSGKRTVIASSSSYTWYPKDTAQLSVRLWAGSGTKIWFVECNEGL